MIIVGKWLWVWRCEGIGAIEVLEQGFLGIKGSIVIGYSDEGDSV